MDVRGKRILVRVDYNVPIDENGNITDDRRIVESLPTIQHLLENGAAVILCSHMGRPKGKVVESLSLAPVAKHLGTLLPKRRVLFTHDIVGDEAREAAKNMSIGSVLLLENLRFDPREEKNDPEFAQQLASLANEYVSDAFGAVHRAHASTAGVANYLPSAVGLLIEKELRILNEALETPKRPFVAILGGAKVESKIGVIENLMTKCDTILIGGAMTYTFLKSMGYEVGTSLVSEDSLDLARSIMERARELNVQFKLPKDAVVSEAFDPESPSKVVDVTNMPENMMGMDIGDKTRLEYSGIIEDAGTVIWNGPMGVFEFPRFALGTKAMALACSACSGTTIVGGGDSAAAISTMGLFDSVTHISTGGGATLELLEGRVLPGIDAIQNINEN